MPAVHARALLAGHQPVIPVAPGDPAELQSARDAELDRTMDVLARELPPLDIHQRIILAREIDAYASRVNPAQDCW
jgi:hypothetical protein